MAGLERKPTKYYHYPHEISVSIPAEDVTLPDGIDYEVPSDTSHVVHTLNIGRVVFDDLPRRFWEQRRAASEPEGEVVSLDRYNETLEALDIPTAPDPSLWRPETTLWVKRFRMAAAVAEAQQGEAVQGQVVMVAGDRNTDTSGLTVVKNGSKFSDALDKRGFPQEAFDYLRGDSRVFANRTDHDARVLYSNPLVRPLTDIFQATVGGPMTAAAHRVIPAGRLITTVRTDMRRQ